MLSSKARGCDKSIRINLVGESYTKSMDQMNSILSYMAIDDINDAVENGRCNSLLLFFQEIQHEVSGLDCI